MLEKWRLRDRDWLGRLLDILLAAFTDLAMCGLFSRRFGLVLRAINLFGASGAFVVSGKHLSGSRRRSRNRSNGYFDQHFASSNKNSPQLPPTPVWQHSGHIMLLA